MERATEKPKEPVWRRLAAVLSAILPVCLYLFIRLRSIAEPGDDALITLKFVRNLVQGNGFVYNPGEWVLGTTTPLYTMFVAVISKIAAADPAIAAPWALLPLEAANILLVWFIVLRTTKSLAAASMAGFLYSLSRYSMFAALLCMEAPLFNFLILSSSVLLSYKDRPWCRRTALALCGATAICRPEGLIFFLVFWGLLLYDERRLKPADFFWFGLLLVPWIIFATIRFGHPIPHSALAKRVGYVSIPHQSTGWVMDYLANLLDWRGIRPDPSFIVLLLNLFLISAGIKYLARRNAAAIAPAMFSTGLWLAYAAANQFMFPWYLSPLDPGFCIAAVSGVLAAASWLAQYKPARVRSDIIVLAVMVPLLALRLFWFDGVACTAMSGSFKCRDSALTFPHYGIRPQGGRIFGREGLYRQVAFDLAGELTPQTNILAPEFGTLGYFTKARIISSVGHINPEILKYLPVPISELDYPAINNGISVEMVKGLTPGYIVSAEIFIRKSLLKDSWFHENYDLIRSYPFAFYGDYGPVMVFKRKS